ncbi:MAG TPA: c-type cytochrome [Acidiferrobacteraceae bacterium]|nr:c-type cytochrome [Acidiferrobacteraceae bacterium]
MKEDRDSLKIFAGLFGGLIALVVVLFVLAQMVVAGANLNPRGAGRTLASRMEPVGQVTVASSVMDTIVTPAQASGAVSGKAVFNGTCSACHGPGIAGAPKFGDKAAWKHHIAKGLPVLYKHALNGFSGKTGVMPARGGNPSLTDAQVEAGVRYMVDHSK